MGSSGGGDTTIRFAEYLEDAHKVILNHNTQDVPIASAVGLFNYSMENCPYDGLTYLDPKLGFFGTGYDVQNFPSLWDMFGKFMAGQDVHDLWVDIYEDVIHGPELENSVTAQSALLQDEIDTNVLPRFLAGMRDINSVQSTTFVVGKAIIQDAHVKSINKFSSDIRLHAIDVSATMWAKHLDWNKEVIDVYRNLFNLYYLTQMESTNKNIEYQVKWRTWGVNLLEYLRATLGALSGSPAVKTSPEPNQATSALGGAMAGASAGAMATGGNPYGAVIGGVLGAAASFV